VARAWSASERVGAVPLRPFLENYTPSQRSQQLTQGGPRVFGDDYMAHCSSIHGQAAFLDEPRSHAHIAIFQTFERFHWLSLPNRLPAEKLEALDRDPAVHEMEEHVAQLKAQDGAPKDVRHARDRLGSYRRSSKKAAFKAYREEWLRTRKESAILSRGRGLLQDVPSADLFQALCLIFPERGRLAQIMASSEGMSPGETMKAMEDLVSLCTRDSTVTYRPGQAPVDGRCPVAGCGQTIARYALDRIPLACAANRLSLPKRQRNAHIHRCLRREEVDRCQRMRSQVHYCVHCFRWVDRDHWDEHCQSHLSSISSKRCGSITHNDTLVRAGHCPRCLGDIGLPPSVRYRPWDQDSELLRHWMSTSQRLAGPLNVVTLSVNTKDCTRPKRDTAATYTILTGYPGMC
jgi:hypothetical protein